jgi:hypothetical protein
MEILSEKIEKVVNMQVEFEDQEYDLLYRHAKDNIPKKVLGELLISWAVNDIVRKYIDAHTKKPAIKKTGKEKFSKPAVKRKTGK